MNGLVIHFSIFFMLIIKGRNSLITDTEMKSELVSKTRNSQNLLGRLIKIYLPYHRETSKTTQVQLGF